MGVLKSEYKSFLDDMEKNIKDKDDLAFIKKRFSDFLDVVLDQMDFIMDYKKEQISQLENTQKELEERMSKMQNIVDNIEKDIYSDEGFDFEIVCPYCNYEFVIDVDENKTEIECPECQNIIELDWSGDLDNDQDACGGECSGCTGCGSEEESPKSDDDDDDM